MRTSEEITYDKLKTLILENQLPCGEFLPQRKLAESVGATIVTLRSSLRLLENDGLLENVPKWGVRIPVENENSIQERYYVRELLEVGAVDKLLGMRDSNIREILTKRATMCDAVKLIDQESFRDFACKHTDFHLTITRLSNNKLLYQELNRLNFRSMMMNNSKYAWEMHNENQDRTYHREFVRLIFESRREDALQIVRKHIQRGCKIEIVTLRRLNQNHKEEKNQ